MASVPKPTVELYETVEQMLRDVNVGTADLTNVPFAAGVAAGVAAERARIIAELRQHGFILRTKAIAEGFVSDKGLALEIAADYIDEVAS